ncbi:MAG: prepilin-type N-terminal cleavage/methylation domain-containing protein [Myxococcota bacterium]
MTHKRCSSAGFTLLEVITVCAIAGVVVLMTYPHMVRFYERQLTKEGATEVAGLLEEARSRATTEATPYLVYFNERTVDANGGCGSAATLVRDSDRTYSVTPGDDVREVEIDATACRVAKPFGDPETPIDMTIPLASQDLAVRGLGDDGGLLGGVGGLLGGVGGLLGAPGEPSGGEEPEPTVAPEPPTLAETVVNGATFPIDAASGRPVVAFSERGIPVDPANPSSWGSGAGAFYVTDGHDTLYAAVVQPLGAVQLHAFDNASRKWR